MASLEAVVYKGLRRRTARWGRRSFEEAIFEVGAARGGGAEAEALEVDGLRAEVVEEAQAAAEEDGHEVEVELVGEAGLEDLAGETGAADDGDVFGAGGGLG